MTMDKFKRTAILLYLTVEQSIKYFLISKKFLNNLVNSCFEEEQSVKNINVAHYLFD